MAANAFSTIRQIIDTPLGKRTGFRLDALAAAGLGDVTNLPYCIKVLLEACLRHLDDFIVTQDHIRHIAKYDARDVGDIEIPFTPGRVVLESFDGAILLDASKP